MKMRSPETLLPNGADNDLWAEESSSLTGHVRIRARIAGLHCSLCTGTIEKSLNRQTGVSRVSVSLTHEQALVDYDPRIVRADEIVATLRDIGYRLYDPRKLRPFDEEENALVEEGKRLLVAIGTGLLAIGLIANVTGSFSILVPLSVLVVMVPVSFAILKTQGLRTALVGAFTIVAPAIAALAVRSSVLSQKWVPYAALVLAIMMVFGVARHILRMAYQSLRRGILNQHVMLEIGAFAGIVGGVIGLIAHLVNYPTASFFAVSVLVVNYHIFSEWLSLLVKTRSSQAVKKLLDLQPDTARVLREGAEVEVTIDQVVVGDLVRVRPGERIPVDGLLRDGHSAVDLSLVTGEPMPVQLEPGGEVIGGSINGLGTLLIEVSRVGEESFLAQIVRHVEDARALKPGILHLVDRILRVYTPSVLGISAFALIGWLVGGAFTGHVDLQRAVFAALSVLVMGYPCAVGIAAPLAIVRGAGDAADQGVIMRTGEAFQTFGSVTHVLLDKTGTLTQGKSRVISVVSARGISDAELLATAAAAESSSEHPLGRAIVNAAFEQNLWLPPVTEFASDTGLGIRALVAGHQVLVGRPSYLKDVGIALDDLSSEIERLEQRGHTVVVVARDQLPLGVIAIGDELRPDAADAIGRMRTSGLIPVLVTGDNVRAARVVAKQLGISEVHAGVLPDGKAQLVRDLQNQNAKVVMAGDGINDAPALMQADVGIAMGGGTDIAVESADVIIVSNEVGAILKAREISRLSYRQTRQNVALAFIFNGIGIPLAATGLVYPVWAMVAMAASVTTIFINSIGGRPSLLFSAIASVGRRKPTPLSATIGAESKV